MFDPGPFKSLIKIVPGPHLTPMRPTPQSAAEWLRGGSCRSADHRNRKQEGTFEPNISYHPFHARRVLLRIAFHLQLCNLIRSPYSPGRKEDREILTDRSGEAVMCYERPGIVGVARISTHPIRNICAADRVFSKQLFGGQFNAGFSSAPMRKLA